MQELSMSLSLDPYSLVNGSASYWQTHGGFTPKYRSTNEMSFTKANRSSAAHKFERDVFCVKRCSHDQTRPPIHQTISLHNSTKRRSAVFGHLKKEKKHKHDHDHNHTHDHSDLQLVSAVVPSPLFVEDDESRLSRIMLCGFMLDRVTMETMRKSVLPHTLQYYSRAMFLSALQHTLHDKHFTHLSRHMSDASSLASVHDDSSLHFLLPDGASFPRLQFSFDSSPDEAESDDPMLVNVATLTISAVHCEYYCDVGSTADDSRLDSAVFRLLMKSLTAVELAVQVNREFERLFGYSQQHIKNLYCRSGIKALYRLYPEHEAQQLVRTLVEGVLRRKSEQIIETTILNRWCGLIKCILRTRILLDEEGFFQSSAYSWTPMA